MLIFHVSDVIVVVENVVDNSLSSIYNFTADIECTMFWFLNFCLIFAFDLAIII